jgi:hypothetical protein
LAWTRKAAMVSLWLIWITINPGINKLNQK